MTALDWQARALAAESALRTLAAQTEGLRAALAEIETHAQAIAQAALSAAPAPGLVLTTDDAETVKFGLQMGRSFVRGEQLTASTAHAVTVIDAALALLARTSETP